MAEALTPPLGKTPLLQATQPGITTILALVTIRVETAQCQQPLHHLHMGYNYL